MSTSGFKIKSNSSLGNLVNNVAKDSFYVGRDAKNELSFNDARISRKHLEVFYLDGECWVKDLNSTNGTLLNGSRINPNIPVKITALDKIVIGTSDIELVIEYMSANVLAVPAAAAAPAIPVKSNPILQAVATPNVFSPKNAEEEAKILMKNANLQSQKILQEGEAKAKKSVQEIYDRAEEHEKKSKALMQQFLTEAQAKAQGLRDQAKQEAQTLVRNAENEASHILSTAKQNAQQSADKIVADARAEFEHEKKLIETEIIENTKMDCEKEIQAKQKEFQTQFELNRHEKQTEIDRLDHKIKLLKEQLTPLSSRHKKLSEEVPQLEGKYRDLTESLKTYEAQKKEFSSLDAKNHHLQQDLVLKTNAIKELEQKQEKIFKELDIQLLEKKKQLEEQYATLEYAEKEKFEIMQANFAEALKKSKAESQGILYELRTDLPKEMALNIEKAFIRSKDTRIRVVEIEKAIVECLDGRFNRLSTDVNTADGSAMGAIQAKNKKVTRRLRLRFASGIAVGVLLFLAYEKVNLIIEQKRNPLLDSIQEQANIRDEDLKRRKFNPPQTEELKDNFVDNVIYTQGFTQTYLNDEFQKRWMKSATHYLLKTWKIDETKSIAALGLINSTVQTLQDKKEKIHPDYVKVDIKKMREIEDGTLVRLREILGSDVKVESLRKFQRAQYAAFRKERVPASSP